jgi:hypothetical protein
LLRRSAARIAGKFEEFTRRRAFNAACRDDSSHFFYDGAKTARSPKSKAKGRPLVVDA